MQNARLAELEKLLAKTSAQPSPRIKSAEMTSSEEMNSLREEIRVVWTNYCLGCLQQHLDEELIHCLFYFLSLRKQWTCCIAKSRNTRVRYDS